MSSLFLLSLTLTLIASAKAQAAGEFLSALVSDVPEQILKLNCLVDELVGYGAGTTGKLRRVFLRRFESERNP